MTEAQYDAHAATNPHAPPYDEAKKRAVRIAIGQATANLDANGDPKMTAAFLAAAISLLVDK